MKSCYLYNYMSFSVFRAYIFCRYLVVNGIFKNSQHNQQIITILHELPFATVMVILPQMKVGERLKELNYVFHRDGDH